jgi:hypothetical protein
MDMSNRDHLRRREEDDDDLFLLILPSLHLLGYIGRSKKKIEAYISADRGGKGSRAT